MAKKLKQILKKAEPTTKVSKGDESFIKKHDVQVTSDANGNDDDVFNASNIKTYERNTHSHGHDDVASQKVYENYKTCPKPSERCSSDNLGYSKDAVNKQIKKDKAPNAKKIKALLQGNAPKKVEEEQIIEGDIPLRQLTFWRKEYLAHYNQGKPVKFAQQKAYEAFENEYGKDKTDKLKDFHNKRDYQKEDLNEDKVGHHTREAARKAKTHGADHSSVGKALRRAAKSALKRLHSGKKVDEAIDYEDYKRRANISKDNRALSYLVHKLSPYHGPEDKITQHLKREVDNRVTGLKRVEKKLNKEETELNELDLQTYDNVGSEIKNRSADLEKRLKELSELASRLRRQNHPKAKEVQDEADKIARQIENHEQTNDILPKLKQKKLNSVVKEDAKSMRLLKTHTNGEHTAKVYRDPDWNEYRVKFFKNGKHLKKADYHTDDLDDAHKTAKKQSMKEETLNESHKNFVKKWNENEDQNFHSENIVMLAKNFGNEKDHAEAKNILKLHHERGELTPDLQKRRQALHDKLWPKAQSLFEETELNEIQGLPDSRLAPEISKQEYQLQQDYIKMLKHPDPEKRAFAEEQLRKRGFKDRHLKIHKEETEQIDEYSTPSLNNFAHRMAIQMSGHSFQQGEGAKGGDEKKYTKHKNLEQRKYKLFRKAMSRLGGYMTNDKTGKTMPYTPDDKKRK